MRSERIIPWFGQEKKEMLFMETALKSSMNKEFNEDLGDLRCDITEREDGLKCISAPLTPNETVFALMDRSNEHESFIENVIKFRDNFKVKS